MADTIGRLQYQIDTLIKGCTKWGLQINEEKTKVIVFRNGGPLRQNEKFFINGKRIETVPMFKYLGLLFTSRLCWSATQRMLAAQADKAVAVIKHISFKCGGLSHELYFKLFDRMVTPILTYGSEIWGAEVLDCIEIVQYKFCKFDLGVAKSSYNAVVLGECGRWPIATICKIRTIKYWLKLLNMSPSRLPSCTYHMLFKLDQVGRKSWATKVKCLLNQLGLGYVWNEQCVGNQEAFLIY